MNYILIVHIKRFVKFTPMDKATIISQNAVARIYFSIKLAIII